MTSLLPFLVLACPLVMAGMMWLMMRSGQGPTNPTRDSATHDEVLELRREIESMRTNPTNEAPDSTREPSDGAGASPAR